MATENRRIATTATETPAETPSLAVATETPSLVVATETPPVATTGTETPPLAVATETPPAAETPPLVVATETPPLVMATETPPVTTTATENAPLGDTLFFLVSIIPALVTGYFLFKTLSLLRRGDPDCTNPRLEWDLGFYIFLVVIFVVASIGVLFRVIAIQVPGIILLLVTSISILVTSWSVQLGGDPYKNHMRIEEVYRLEGYAPWAQKFLLQDRGWKDFQNCLIERKICDKVQKIRGFYQEGCRIPPPYCGYEDRNQTWVIPKTGRYADNVNCIRWDGDKRKCYDCESCQAEYMNAMDFIWTFRALLLIFGWGVLGAFLMLTVAINATSKIKGATKEQIERLPKYKFRKTGEFENQNGENQESFGGIMRKCGTDVPIERVLSLKDAECCICLCAYVDGTELRELLCRHHFHCSCIDTWLHIKATCPLCKFNALKNGNRSGSQEV